MNNKSKLVKLKFPLTQEGDTTLTEVTLRKPKAGELRGLQLSLIQMQDVDAMMQLIPRISELREKDLHNLEMEDFAHLSVETLGFFVTMD